MAFVQQITILKETKSPHFNRAHQSMLLRFVTEVEGICNFNYTSGTNASIFYYYSVTISIKPQKLWGSMFMLSTYQFSAAYDKRFSL